MGFWFYLAVFGLLWLVIGLAVAWLIGSAFRLGGSVPLRQQADLWADGLQRETFNDWPPRVDGDPMYDRCVCGGIRCYCGEYFTPARGYDWRKDEAA